jgi:hypothetical protein
MTMFNAGTVENMKIEVVAGTGINDFHPKARLDMKTAFPQLCKLRG